MKRIWGDVKCSKGSSKKLKVKEAVDEDDDDEEMPSLPLIFQNAQTAAHLYHHSNHIYFNNDITDASCFTLCKELRTVHNKLKMLASQMDIGVNVPIYLHLKSNGGSIHAAFTVVDCIKSLGSPVYTVIDGFVASAGTLISIAGTKKFIQPNAYTLIHQLSSGMWGKMTEIDDTYNNLKKLSEHLISFYHEHTQISRKNLKEMLSKDIEWNAAETIAKGLVDGYYEV